MKNFKGYFTLLRDTISTYTENKRIISQSTLVGGAIMSTDGWVINCDLQLKFLYITNIRGYHRYISYESTKKIKQKTIVRMTYDNCYLGVYHPKYRCAMPFTREYFDSYQNIESNLYNFNSINGFIPMTPQHLVVGESSYIKPLLGLDYIKWLNLITNSNEINHKTEFEDRV